MMPMDNSPDNQPTTCGASTQEGTQPVDGPFASEFMSPETARVAMIAIDACAAIVDERRVELNRDHSLTGNDARWELFHVARCIRALKKHV